MEYKIEKIGIANTLVVPKVNTMQNVGYMLNLLTDMC